MQPIRFTFDYDVAIAAVPGGTDDADGDGGDTLGSLEVDLSRRKSANLDLHPKMGRLFDSEETGSLARRAEAGHRKRLVSCSTTHSTTVHKVVVVVVVAAASARW